MNMIRRSPRGLSALDPFAGIDSILDNMMRPVRLRDLENDLHMPSTDIHETRDAYEVTAELPGIRKEDIQVTLQEGVLSIEAESKSESEEKKEGAVIRRERRYGKFLRRFAIGPDVQEDKVQARFEDGLLKLVIPKVVQKNGEKRSIEIG